MSLPMHKGYNQLTKTMELSKQISPDWEVRADSGGVWCVLAHFKLYLKFSPCYSLNAQKRANCG